ncbi:zinc ribbon domain-containing protein [Streptomyces sp. NPDC002730]|uniref:zinc ribbon domain-containing protein n=1 Tax=Streptomyces sp. NPDC002730 TaxID=3364662 RepID=UPI00369673F1
MASYCPHCGNPSPDEARFCMKCGRERLPEASAAPPPAMPPAAAPAALPALPPALPAAQPAAPAYAPVPAQPSPVGAFLGRAFRGDWLASAKAAAWPAGLLLALAVALAIPSYGQDDEVVVGWSDRLRIALAMLLQAFGGGFEVKATDSSSPFGSGGSGSGSYGGGSSDGMYGDGSGFPGTSGSGSSGFSDSGMDAIAQGSASLSLVPLTVTVLWIGALFLGARMLRTRGAGLEAAVRISVLATGVVLVLGLFAQPEIEGVEISSSPLLAALGALAISLAVTAGVLQRDDLAAWLAQRPAARSTVRALGTAVRALGAVVALCSLVGFIAYANADGVDGTGLLIALPILPNIGLAVLGLSWGVPVKYDVQGRFSLIGSGTEHGSFGLPEISDVWGGGAVAGAVALGVVCALTLGVWAARRSADRREQLLAGGFSLGLVLLFTGVSGVSAEMAGGMSDWGGQGTSEFAPSVPDALLFGLLWVGAATFLGPYVLRMVGQQAAAVPLPAYGQGPAYMPGAPAAPAAPAATPFVAEAPAPPAPSPYVPQPPVPGAYDPHTVQLSASPSAAAAASPAAAAHDPAAAAAAAERKRKVLVWTATLTAAFVIGGGATAGALLLKNNDASDEAKNKQPAASQSPSPKQDPQAPASPSATPSGSPSATPSTSPSTPPPGGATVPEGFALKQDPAGFTVAVMDGWKRRQSGSQVFYEAPTGGSYVQIGVIKNTPTTSYENFLTLEKKHLETPETQYERTQLIQNTYQGRPGALWEFTHVPEPDEGSLKRHVIDQAFVAADGTEYAILAAGRADLWDPAKDVVFSTALNTFKVSQ